MKNAEYLVIVKIIGIMNKYIYMGGKNYKTKTRSKELKNVKTTLRNKRMLK